MFETKCRVRYEETDKMGVVYHSNYIIYFEVGRTEYLRELGVPYTSMEKSGVNLAVTEVQASFIKPAIYDNLLTIQTRISECGKARITLHYRVLHDGELLCQGRTTLAFLDASRDNRPMRAPPDVVAKVAPAIEKEWP